MILEELIEVKEKLISTSPLPFELSKLKLVGLEGLDELKNSVEIFSMD